MKVGKSSPPFKGGGRGWLLHPVVKKATIKTVPFKAKKLRKAAL